MRPAHGVVGAMILLTGIVHLAATPGVADEPDASALWFAGSGLFLIAAGLLNLAALRAGGSDPLVVYTALLVNVLGALMAAWSIPAVGGAAAYMLVVLFGVASLIAFISAIKSRSTEGASG